jgi:hypothetical protein
MQIPGGLRFKIIWKNSQLKQNPRDKT